MTRYALSRRADAQLDNIFEFTLDRFGLRQAERYRDSLLECFAMLAENPQMGRLARNVGAGVRRHEHGGHVILYESREVGIKVLAVLHSRQRIR